MADKLAKVRTKFVEKVNRELIKQLLDDILEDGIVNEGEKDSILEDNVSTADKARDLIDTVKRKGDEASWKMIAHLQRRDQTLHKTLGLPSVQPAQPAVEPQMEQKQSTTLFPTNDNSYCVTEESIRSRVALLITNIKFTNEKKKKDEQNMEKQLKELGYEVVKHTNLTGKEIDDAVIEFSKHQKLKQTDSVFVVIMSHGKLGVVHGVNFKDQEPDEFPIDNIYKHLGTKKCPALLNKPKIIIIQACRGDRKGSVLISDSTKAAMVCDGAQQPDLSLSAGEEDIEADTTQYEHKEKDFISFLSCTPDTLSYKDEDNGSFLIQYIVEVFHNCWRENDIEELFRKVMQRFDDFLVPTERGQDTQMPTKERATLTKRFYLFPGH